MTDEDLYWSYTFYSYLLEFAVYGNIFMFEQCGSIW